MHGLYIVSGDLAFIELTATSFIPDNTLCVFVPVLVEEEVLHDHVSGVSPMVSPMLCTMIFDGDMGIANLEVGSHRWNVDTYPHLKLDVAHWPH